MTGTWLSKSLILYWLLSYGYGINTVLVLHHILPQHGQILTGDHTCDESFRCVWISGALNTLATTLKSQKLKKEHNLITLSLYNVHSWWEKSKRHFPALCELMTNLSVAESEESHARYGSRIFDQAFKHYDGNFISSI
jgi:hypothetical protein